MTRPADVWLLVRIVAWSVCLPVLKYLLPLAALVRLMGAGKAGGERRPERKRSMRHAYLPLSRRVLVLAVRFQSALEKLPAVLDGLRQVVNQAVMESP